MPCMHVCIWLCEQVGFVWKILCFMLRVSFIYSCFIYVYIYSQISADYRWVISGTKNNCSVPVLYV